MYEFHADDCKELHTIENEKFEFGGTTSHLKSPNDRPLMIFGQDEAVFNQYSMNNLQWVGPNGERALLPKTAGCGIMVSAFQSRELGFGVSISSEELEEINKHMRKGKNTVISLLLRKFMGKRV